MAQSSVRFLAQLDLLNLAGAGHRKLLEHADVARDVVACDLAAAVFGNVLRGDFLLAFELNAGDGDLAQAWIGMADHRHGLDGRMAEQVQLNLPRIDIRTPDFEHVFVATHKAQVPVGPHYSHVAGVQPTVAVDGRGGFLGLAVVALHDHVAAHHKLAGRAWRLLCARFRIDDLDVVAWGRTAGSLDTLRLRRIDRTQGGADADLTHAVAGQQTPENLARFPSYGHRARHPRGANARADARGFTRLPVVGLEQILEVRVETVNDGGPFCCQQP